MSFVEGEAGSSLLTHPDEVNQVIEACFSHRVRKALLYAENMTAGFFDLSSTEAGTILQKLRNYDLQLAVVNADGRTPVSSRFGEMVAEERQRRHFGVFETRDAALEWLR